VYISVKTFIAIFVHRYKSGYNIMKANAINLDTTNVKPEPRWEWACEADRTANASRGR
jgi:hypothetical protein